MEQVKPLPAMATLVTNYCTTNEARQRTRMEQWSHDGCPGEVWDYDYKPGDRVLRYCGCWCHD